MWCGRSLRPRATRTPLARADFRFLLRQLQGVIIFVRVMDGSVRPGMDIRMMSSGAEFHVVETGFMGATSLTPADGLLAGQVGYIAASIKNVRDTKVGDTVTDADRPASGPLEGYREAMPGVSPAFIRWTAQSIPTCATRWKSSSSTTRPSPSSRRRRWRLASASAAVFWAFCTWKLFRSGWSANTIWTSSPRCPRLSTASR